MHEKKDIESSSPNPPWVEYPGYPPFDTFWRQSGEYWFHEVWRPFWENLSLKKQEAYLKQWEVPDLWQRFYFDPEFTKWLESVDNEE